MDVLRVERSENGFNFWVSGTPLLFKRVEERRELAPEELAPFFVGPKLVPTELSTGI